MPPAALEILVRKPDAGGFTLVHLDRGRALLSMRPRPLSATLHHTDTGVVLRSADGARHLRLSEPEAFLWEHIDGSATVEELATAWFLRFGSIDFSRVLAFIQLARRTGFVEMQRGGFLRSRLAPAWFEREWRWTEVDAGVRAILRPIRPLIRPIAVVPLLTLVLLGIGAAGVRDVSAVPLHALAFAGFWLLHLFPHEAAHALACAAFGRRVRAVGVGWRGVFVDTTDMFLSSRREHATVALAGPASNLIFASIASIASVALPFAAWRDLAAVAADAGFAMAFVAGWPFLLAGDGYNALSDALEAPRLRAESWRGLWTRRLSVGGATYLAGVVLTWATAAAWVLVG